MRAGARAAAVVVALASVASVDGAMAAEPRADLRGEADRLAAAWAREGQVVSRVAPVFVEHGRVKLLQIEPSAATPRPPAFPTGCTTVALVGVRTAEFTAEPERGLLAPRGEEIREGGDDDRRAKSSSGVVVLGRCGPEQADLRRVVVDMTSARSAIEIVVARAERGPSTVSDALPERAQGPLAPRGDAGGPIEPGPLTERLARATARAQADGAAKTVRAEVRAQDNGSGAFALRLAAGCHRLEVFADVPARAPHRPIDVDAEARDAETGRVLARDRADVPDARLDVCVGDASRVDVPFVGAAEGGQVVVTDAHFPIPARIPARFGARARGGFAWAFHRRHAPAPTEDPIASSIGVEGTTSVPLEVEPGRCYLAAVAVTKGEARSLRLSADVGGRVARDDAADRADGAAVAFCAETSRRARLEVDARGNTAWWSLVVWPAGTTAP